MVMMLKPVFGLNVRYSQVVVGDYTDMVTIFDRNLGMDLTEEIPVIKKRWPPTRNICFRIV